jgi:beta-N-acetylhexosaminidase
MAAVGKHFPGHGCVAADSHLALPVDKRSFAEIEKADLIPFRNLIDYGLDAIMPAHVIYEKVSPQLAGFCPFWLKDVLRKKMSFQGVIFSDDLTMMAAEEAGGYPDRAKLALEAGCDMVLVCNNNAGAVEVLDSLSSYNNPVSHSRLARMHGHSHISRKNLHLKTRWHNALKMISQLHDEESFDLDLNDPTSQ